MTYELIISLASLGVAITSVIVSACVNIYQIHSNQNMEKEKERLEIYSEFLAYCTKKNANCANLDETHNFIKIYTKAMLTTDHELNELTKELYFSVLEHPQSNKTIQLLDLATCKMHERLEIFNRENHPNRKHY